MPGALEPYHVNETPQIRDFEIRRDLDGKRESGTRKPTRTVHPHCGQPECFGWHMVMIETLRHVEHLPWRDTEPSEGEVEILQRWFIPPNLLGRDDVIERDL